MTRKDELLAVFLFSIDIFFLFVLAFLLSVVWFIFFRLMVIQKEIQDIKSNHEYKNSFFSKFINFLDSYGFYFAVITFMIFTLIFSCYVSERQDDYNRDLAKFLTEQDKKAY